MPQRGDWIDAQDPSERRHRRRRGDNREQQQRAAVRQRIHSADAEQFARQNSPEESGEGASGHGATDHWRDELAGDGAQDMSRSRAECEPDAETTSRIRAGHGDGA